MAARNQSHCLEKLAYSVFEWVDSSCLSTTFEWDDFRLFLGNRQDRYLLLVLLGGHGRSYEAN